MENNNISRDNRTSKNAKKKKRRKKRYLLRFFVFILLCVGLYFVLHISYFNINVISVVGNKEITDEKIVELSQIKKENNVFDVHPWLVQHRIKKNLYIADVNVNRKPPNKVEIIITERVGKSQLKMGKAYVIADGDGMVIEVSNKEREVTLVQGVTVERAKVKRDIKVKEEDLYEKAKSLIIAAEEGDLYFKKITIKKGMVEAYVYDTLLCTGRYNNLMTSIEKGQLKSVIYDLYQKGIEKGKISIGSNNYCSFTP